MSSVPCIGRGMAVSSTGNKSHADTYQPSTVGFQILINSERTVGRIDRPTRFTPDTIDRRDLMQILNGATPKES